MDIFKRPSGTHRGNGLLEGARGWGGAVRRQLQKSMPEVAMA